MARLPQPGGDAGNWGNILNDYLAASHKADGTIKDNTVGSAQLQDDSVTNAALADDSVNASTIADGTITETLLAAPVQTKLNAPATIADGSITNAKLASDAVSKGQLQPTLRTEIDDKLNQTVASTIYAPRNLAAFVTLGDSRTLLNGAVSTDSASSSGTISKENRGYVTQAMVILRQRMHWLKNGGVGNNTVAQMLARTDALLDLNPGWLIGFGVINSINTEGASSATIIDQLTQIFDKCTARGVRVVWGTDWISGGTNTVEKRLAAAEVNNWLRHQATRRPDFYLADYAAVMGDTETGIIPASLGQDLLHQDAPGAYRMTQELVRVLDPLIPPSDRLLAYNGDPTNYLVNGMFTGNSSGLATGWSKGSSTATPTKIARTDGFVGEWQQVSCTNETVTSLTRQVVLSSTDLVEGVPIFAEL